MRMRKKKNLLPRMERCAEVRVMEPERLRGKWLEVCRGFRELQLELGCGKGRFTVRTAEATPDALIVAVEKVPEAMVVAMERAVGAGVRNARFISADVSRVCEFFAGGEVSRIYINFCDPWPPKRQAKRRLTSEGFLRLYLRVLKPGGEIHFKTDNAQLFEYSLEQFAGSGFSLSEVTRDLHADGPTGVMTDYEARFYSEGLPIKRCVAVKPADAGKRVPEGPAGGGGANPGAAEREAPMAGEPKNAV